MNWSIWCIRPVYSVARRWCIRPVYSVARRCPDQSFLLRHRSRVAGLSMLYKVNSSSNHCLFSERPPASTRVRHSRAASAAHPVEFEVSRCRTSRYSQVFPSGSGSNVEWPSLHRVWDRNAGWVQGYSQPLVDSLSCVYFFRNADACGVAKTIFKQLRFSHLDLCCC